jgi:general secretion pathway protein I
MRLGLARRRGFSLIEALAAFAIMALALGELLRAVSLGAQSERRADFFSRAALDGASQIAEIGVSQPLQPAESAGRYDDGLRWRLSVAPDRVAAGLDGRAVLVSYRLRLVVLPADGRAPGLTLIAEKLVAPKPWGGGP